MAHLGLSSTVLRSTGSAAGQMKPSLIAATRLNHARRQLTTTSGFPLALSNESSHTPAASPFAWKRPASTAPSSSSSTKSGSSTTGGAAAASPSSGGKNATRLAEKQIAKAQRGAMKIPGLVMGSQLQPLQDLVILPKWSEIGGDRLRDHISWTQYTRTRLTREYRNWVSINEMKNRWLAFPMPYTSPGRMGRLIGWFKSWSSQWLIGPTVAECEEIWKRWNKAIYANDLNALDSTCKGLANTSSRQRAARQSAQLSKFESDDYIHRVFMSWDSAEHVRKPTCVHARCMQLDTQGNYLAQIVIRFDAYHQINVRSFNKAPMTFSHHRDKIKRGVQDRRLEFIVFERVLTDPNSNWMIRDKVAPYLGGGPLPEMM